MSAPQRSGRSRQAEVKRDKLTMSVDRPKLTPEDEKKLMEAQAKAGDNK